MNLRGQLDKTWDGDGDGGEIEQGKRPRCGCGPPEQRGRKERRQRCKRQSYR